MTAGASPWSISTSSGDAAPFHHRPDPPEPVPSLWVHHITRPVLVLGSSQPEEVIDRPAAERDGLEVCRRRTGGGVVALVPGAHLWIDLVIPASSQLWDDDVGLAFHWVGATWARVLDQVLVDGSRISVHRGPQLQRAAGRVLCFAGVGSGEVSVDDHKVVGLSQRRWRRGARFQCAALWRWEPSQVLPYLSPNALASAGIDLAELRIGLPARRHQQAELDPDRVVEALVAALPEP